MKKLKQLLKNQKGLTLVELLAVVVILGIIAAIAVPSIGGIIENSREDAQVANAETLHDAARLAVIGENVTEDTALYVNNNDDNDMSNSSNFGNEIDLNEGGYLGDDFLDPMNDNAAYEEAYVEYTADTDSFTITMTGEDSESYFSGTEISEIRTDGRDALVQNQ
ncbi:pilus assembly FimT family protein [Alkalicoccus urumqiensis]|uniref:Prepilin-type cleavage/methylation domain-containing protein n=1 Tax=Alkalicoccus urumqiensis TaxID=1548213 RepID=A0A2P6MF79_ALKUR|nr:prepilin-type N-terminal cleavage/methylation domain-containing protein [Alkalicoccus urumqiensis]PRO64901.1 prepilin-type cleavage/methylation domain-containing protein [Alkalicoccus urumqiensis]